LEFLCIARQGGPGLEPASPQRAAMAALTPPDVWHSRPAGEGASFCVPRCRGRNGQGGGCSVVWRPCTLAGHSPLPSAPRFRGGPWGQSATLPPVPSPHRGRRFAGITGAVGSAAGITPASRVWLT